MRGYEFSMTRILIYKEKIVDSDLCWRMRVNENPYSRVRKHFGINCSFLAEKNKKQNKTIL